MKISVRQQEGTTILDVKGKITIGVGDVALREAVQEALEAGARKLLLNLKDVTTIDSSGIGEMVSAFTTVSNRGGKLALLNVPSKVVGILEMTQLITVFDSYDDEAEAIEALSG